ncbi:hypothetical protein BC938DRAFT_477202 [Jimgerdemannia flammicorona]|uniref:Uncharacterized protein n=1 Tax=Jimgerdemannia flammicorona TaxID=994334 RepID=A0A433QPP7_9FUNG|nr:hypothetical protein BC938DRAFT_477202 [Jimgerdemannia flammicorona]
MAVNEATKVLSRMRERTQRAYVWFAGSFLKILFAKMFESIRVQEEDISRWAVFLKKQIRGKRVVYVPVSKTLIDPLLVWYVVIRYQLPVPAIALDEAISTLGPIADLFRISGGYFIKRDITSRSPLNTAVTAAYTQVLLREHNSLAFVLEKARTRTGKVQPPHQDGLVNMIMEATLEANQNPASLLKSNGVGADDDPSTPITPVSPGGATKLVSKDVVFVPINITYERIPELSILTDEVLDQRPRAPTSNRLSLAVPPPSQAMVDRAKKVHSGAIGGELSDEGRFGRALFGIGKLVSVQDVVENDKLQKRWVLAIRVGLGCHAVRVSKVVEKVTKAIQEGQRRATILSPVSLVAAIGAPLDWQDGEDMDAIIFYAFRLLDEPKNILIDGKEISDETNVRSNDHADNIMTLSYFANQLIDIFLAEALFSVVYLSYSGKYEPEQDVMDKFRFLVQLFEEEFVFPWDPEEKFREVVEQFVTKGLLTITNEDNVKNLTFMVNQQSDFTKYHQLCFFASLIYPTLDAYWITSCSLSALENVPFLPRKTVPVLSQWIATHLIAGRRTIYREVLSTEASRNAVNIFMALGFIRDVMEKEKLTPDAQALLYDLGIPTNETLVEMANHDASPAPVPVDNQELMMKLMAQIEMNRATSNIADLCTQIDGYRFGANNPKESYQNAQVFSKCQKQIKSILKSDQSYAKKKNLTLSREEDDMIQLVYSLKQSAATPLEGYKASRRVSEVYNLRPQFIPQ